MWPHVILYIISVLIACTYYVATLTKNQSESVLYFTVVFVSSPRLLQQQIKKVGVWNNVLKMDTPSHMSFPAGDEHIMQHISQNFSKPIKNTWVLGKFLRFLISFHFFTLSARTYLLHCFQFFFWNSALPFSSPCQQSCPCFFNFVLSILNSFVFIKVQISV